MKPANGSVCALPLPDSVRLSLCGNSCPVPVVYLFTDDNSPAAQ